LILLTAVFVTLERLFTLRPQKILCPAFLTDLGHFFLTSLLPSVLLSVPLAIVAWAVHLAGPVGASGTLLPALVIVVGTAWGFFIHANVRWRFGLLESLVSTSAFHHWHHTMDDHTNRNYAAMLPWLDRIFETFYLPPRQWPSRYGTDTPVGATLTLQLIRPIAPQRSRPN